MTSEQRKTLEWQADDLDYAAASDERNGAPAKPYDLRKAFREAAKNKRDASAAIRAALREVDALRDALVEIERRLREDAAPLAAVAQASGKREVERAWKAVYSAAIHAQGALSGAPVDSERDALRAQVDALTKRLDDAVEYGNEAAIDAMERNNRMNAEYAAHRDEANRLRAQVDALTQQVADLEARAIPKAWVDDVEIHRGSDLGDEETIVAGQSGATWRKMSGYASADGYPRRFPTLSAALSAAKETP